MGHLTAAWSIEAKLYKIKVNNKKNQSMISKRIGLRFQIKQLGQGDKQNSKLLNHSDTKLAWIHKLTNVMP